MVLEFGAERLHYSLCVRVYVNICVGCEHFAASILLKLRIRSILSSFLIRCISSSCCSRCKIIRKIVCSRSSACVIIAIHPLSCPFTCAHAMDTSDGYVMRRVGV